MGTIDSTAPPPKFLDGAHQWIESNAGWLAAVAALLLTMTIVLTVVLKAWNWTAGAAAALFLIASMMLFTRPLGRIEDPPAPMNAIFRYAYAFIFAVLIFGGVALYSPQLFKTVPADVEKESPERIFSPVAIVPGCDYAKIAEADPKASPATRDAPAGAANGATRTNSALGTRAPNDAMPVGAFCGELPPQWVISIGGNILSCHFDGTCPQYLPQPKFDPGLQARLTRVQAMRKRAQSELNDLNGDIDYARYMGERHRGTPLAVLIAERDKQRMQVDSLTDQEADLTGQIDIAKRWQNSLWHVDGRPIVGGLVVPVYFVVLAVLGALISMMRKIPEFQERVEPDYPEEFKKRAEADEGPLTPISRSRARDFVVFQILQVVSAPTIAIVAYSWARPDDLATTAILAFAAGFSSEVFLVAIRAVVDRVIGLGPRPARARAIVEAEKKVESGAGTLPPRGPEVSGGLKVGDNVTLAKPVGVAMPGAKGVVLSIEAGGELNVKLTQDHTGMPVAIFLRPAPPESFQRSSEDKQQPEGPAG